MPGMSFMLWSTEKLWKFVLATLCCKVIACLVWWCTPFVPALGRQKYVEFFELKASLTGVAGAKPAKTA